MRKAEQIYGSRGAHPFGPLFTDYGDAVVFGNIDGRVLIWDKRRGRIAHEMDHGAGMLDLYLLLMVLISTVGTLVQAVAVSQHVLEAPIKFANVFLQSFDGEEGEQHLISSTRQGLLTWWRLPIRIF